MSTSKKLRRFTQLSILIALILIMGFTPLGYLKAGLIEISFITIPVVIGAIVLGPSAGAILGLVFGITSFIQCFGMSAFGAQLLSINPIMTAILCIIPRVIMGFLAGLIFVWLKKLDKGKIISFGVASLSGALLNTVLFVGGLILLFGNSEYITSMMGGKNILAFAVAFVGVNGLIEAAATTIIGTTVSKVLAITINK